MSLFDAYETLILKAVVGKEDFAKIPSLHVGLCTQQPQESASAIYELSGGGYARASAPPSSWDLKWEGSLSWAENVLPITFPEATTDWGIVTHFILTVGAAGPCVVWGELATAKNITQGSVPRFAAGDLWVGLD